MLTFVVLKPVSFVFWARLSDSAEVTSEFWLNILNHFAVLDKRQDFLFTSSRVTKPFLKIEINIQSKYYTDRKSSNSLDYTLVLSLIIILHKH